jgi:hypothetical protein
MNNNFKINGDYRFPPVRERQYVWFAFPAQAGIQNKKARNKYYF